MPTANPGRAAIYCPKARCQSLKHRRFPSFFVFLRILQITLIYKCEFHQVTLARLGAIGYIPRSPTQANSLASTPAERCRSGRTGRSRKPLCAQAYRGFESLPLRHSPLYPQKRQKIRHFGFDGETIPHTFTTHVYHTRSAWPSLGNSIRPPRQT